MTAPGVEKVGVPTHCERVAFVRTPALFPLLRDRGLEVTR